MAKATTATKKTTGVKKTVNKIKAPKQKSSDDDITTLKDTAAIRKRPGMYIGTIGAKGVLRMYIEAIGNVLDLYSEDAVKNMFVSVNESTHEITVSDDGYGIPLGKLLDIMTITHTSGKFKENGFTIGMNGVGLKVINALSISTTVIVKRDGYKWKQTFSKGIPTSELEKLEKTKETGTTVIFKPDIEILKDISIDSAEYLDFIETISYFSRGLKITFHATRKSGGPINKVLLSKNGLIDYLNAIEKNPIVKNHIYMEDKQEDKQLYIALNYSVKSDEEVLLSHVNNMKTIDHGTHVQGFRMALTEVIKKYIDENSLIPKKDSKLIEITGDDVREGITAIIEVKWIEPVFDGQTKDKLTSTEAMGYVKKVVVEQLTNWMATNKNEARAICGKIILSAKGRLAAKRAKSNTKKKEQGFASISNISKFTKAELTDPDILEIYIVEGDSAGGSASQGRDTDYQSIYRLRGKPLNTHDLEVLKIMSNKEFNDIINILKCGFGKDFNPSNISHKKIIIMTDADTDGDHIFSLFSTFLFTHMRPLIEAGFVYVAQPPLYKIKDSGKEIYIKNKDEYNTHINNKIISLFTIGTIENKKAIPMKTTEIKNLIKDTRRYLIDLKNISSKFALDTSLVEYIAMYHDRELKQLGAILTKVFPDLEIKLNKAGLFVQGLIGDNYQSILINDTFINEIDKIIEVYKGNKGSQFFYKLKTDSKVTRSTLGELLTTIFDYATPKHKQRYKGLGEMNPEQLWETTMDPSKRKLVQLKISDYDLAKEKISNLMGKNADKRKEFMANFEIQLENLDS